MRIEPNKLRILTQLIVWTFTLILKLCEKQKQIPVSLNS